MAAYQITNITSIIYEKIYPIVENKLKSRTNQFKAMIADYINRNHKVIFDVAPYSMIYYRESDKKEFFKSLDLDEKEILNLLKETCFWPKPFNPGCAKEPYVEVCMCAIKYFLKNKKQKEAELTTIYLCFSGKFYASLFTAHFPKAAPDKNKAVMDYVVNNMLSNKFDLKTTGSVFGAIQNMCITWLNTYNDDLISDLDDLEVANQISQIRTRENSFLYNISQKYYQAYESKSYLNSEHENLDSEIGQFNLTENDSNRAARLTQNSLMYMLNNSVSIGFCNSCKDSLISAMEIKDIMESILGNKDNIPDIQKVINIIICDFIKNNPKKRIGSADFFAYTRQAKPNSKDAYINELKKIIVSWLDENSANYRRRKSRLATANSYYNAIILYFTLAISTACQRER